MNEAGMLRSMRTLTLLGLLLASVLVSCEPIGPRECDYGISTVQGRIVRSTPKAMVPVPHAEVRFVSIQTVFECPGGRNAEPLLLITDEQGSFDGFLEAYEDDEFEVTISVKGCEPLVIKPVNRGAFLGRVDYLIHCDAEK